MKNFIGKGKSIKEYFYFSWSYFYCSAGYYFCAKSHIPLCNEFDKRKFLAGRGYLLG